MSEVTMVWRGNVEWPAPVKVGSYGGIDLFTDPFVPEDEVQVWQDGKLVARLRTAAEGAGSEPAKG